MIFIWEEPGCTRQPGYAADALRWVACRENGPVRVLGRLDVWQEEGLCADVEQMLDQDRVVGRKRMMSARAWVI